MKTMSAVTWIAIWADNAATDGTLIGRDMAFVLMSATQVDGQKTEAEWDALFAAAREAESTMKEAEDFG